MMWIGPACLAAGLLVLMAGAASAHTSERAFILTLPTDLYLAAGTATVAVSFLLVALAGSPLPRRLGGIGVRLARVPSGLADAASIVLLGLVAALVAVGWWGTQDPLANLLPLAVWTVWWIGLTLLCALLGDLWAIANPWRGAHALLARVPGLGRFLARPPFAYPPRLGAWPAVAGFLAFAWFELVSQAPQAPAPLATAVAIYLVVNLAGTLLFGLRPWLANAEAFSLYFRMVAWLSPLDGRPEGDRAVLTVPGGGLLHLSPLPPARVAFVLLALASVSFDGLMRTFWWLDRLGLNPLEFPGRSAVFVANSLGLVGVFGALGAVFVLAIRLGQRLEGDGAPLAPRAGQAVVAIVPIALGYHLAHYLTAFLVDIQFAGAALAALVAADVGHPTTSFLASHGPVRAIWHVLVALIVAAHVAAVVVAHAIALRDAPSPRAAILRQAPLTLLMVGYTLFGLWLLATPVIGG
jgi:hypothetical protein